MFTKLLHTVFFSRKDHTMFVKQNVLQIKQENTLRKPRPFERRKIKDVDALS